MAKPNLQKLLKKWQKILRLEDWDIQIRWARSYELAEASSVAENLRDVPNKRCDVRVLDPIDFVNSVWPERDYELDIVHELLHTHVEAFAREFNGTDNLKEQVIETLAKALVALERKR